MPKSAEQNRIARDSRRDQILVSALKAFSVKGLGATKISDIAQEASISQGLLYRYFKSKDEIFAELIRGAFERMNLAANELTALPLPANEKIRTAILQLLQAIESNEDFPRYVLLIAQSGISDSVPDGVRKIIEENAEIPYKAMAKIFAEGQCEGTVKDYEPEEMAVLFWITIKGLAMHKAALGPGYVSPNPHMILDNFLK